MTGSTKTQNNQSREAAMSEDQTPDKTDWSLVYGWSHSRILYLGLERFAGLE